MLRREYKLIISALEVFLSSSDNDSIGDYHRWKHGGCDLRVSVQHRVNAYSCLSRYVWYTLSVRPWPDEYEDDTPLSPMIWVEVSPQVVPDGGFDLADPECFDKVLSFIKECYED